MTLHEWTHSEATLKQLAPSVYRQLEANIIKAEQRKSEAWQRIQQRIGNSATQKGRDKMLLTRINEITTPQGEIVLYRRSRGLETWVPKYVLYKAGCQVEEYRHIQSAHKGYNELVVQNATVIKIKEPRIKR